MRTTSWRLAGVGALAAGLALAGTAASASQPSTYMRQGTEVSCSLIDAEEETKLYVSALFSPEGELVEWWGDAVIEDLPVWVSDGSGTLDDASYTLELAFSQGEMGDDVGTLTVDGTVTPFGDPIAVDERYREGNAWTTVRGTVQPLLVTGDVSEATGALADFAGTELTCDGSEVDLSYRSTNPATRIFRGTAAGAQCQIDEDSVLDIEQLGETTFAAYGDGIDWDTGAAEFVAVGDVVIDGAAITGSLEVVQPPPAGDPEYVQVDLAIGDEVASGMDKFSSPSNAYHVKYTLFELTGDLTLPDATVVPIDCQYSTYTFWERFSPNAGQKPGGKPPVNDVPAKAVALPDGATVSVSTRGAAEMPEASCSVTLDGETFDLPFGRTVWYSFTGTGAEVALTTVGSEFVTVLGVYDADTLEQVACVFDTEETGLQASLVLPTDDGAGYLVQAGGFDGEWGQLVISRP